MDLDPLKANSLGVNQRSSFKAQLHLEFSLPANENRIIWSPLGFKNHDPTNMFANRNKFKFFPVRNILSINYANKRVVLRNNIYARRKQTKCLGG